MGEAAGAAAAQDEADRAPRQASNEMAHVGVRSVANMMMGRDAPLRQPPPGARGSCSPLRVHQDKLGGGACQTRAERIGLETTQDGRRVSPADEQNAIRLTKASSRPWRRPGVRLIHDKLVTSFLLAEPPDDPAVLLVIWRKLGHTSSQAVVHQLTVDVQSGSHGSQRRHEVARHVRQRRVLTRGDEDNRGRLRLEAR